MIGRIVTIGDLMVIALATALVVSLYVTLWGGGAEQAEFVEIMVGDETFARIELAEQQVFSVSGTQGVSELEIRDGRIRFLSSPCRGKICLRAGWLDHAGDVAACLPNRVSVSLSGGEPLYDSINY